MFVKIHLLFLQQIKFKQIFLITDEAQTQLATVTERERSASEKLMDISTKITSLESQNSHLKQDKSQLTAQLELLKSKIEVLEDAKNRYA